MSGTMIASNFQR